MSLVCKNCKSEDLVNENSETVCTNCGHVQDELTDSGRLCMLPDHEATLENFRNKKSEACQRLTARIRGETNSSIVRRQIALETLSDDMRRLVRQLIKDPDAVNETMDLVNSTFNRYKSRLIKSKKLGLVGACIYYINAKHQLGISLTEICRVLDIKMKGISSCLKQVKQLCPKFEFERPNMKDLVKKFVDDLSSKRYDLSSVDVTNSVKSSDHLEKLEVRGKPLITTSDRIVLENRIMLLIDLFEAMHPYNQPSHQTLITAVVYHAWKSLDTFKMIATDLSSEIHRGPVGTDLELEIDESGDRYVALKAIIVKHKIGFEKFCQICNVKYSSSGHKIVSKLQSSLLMLGKYLGDVNKFNLPWYLKDIIENSSQLLQEHTNRAES